MKTKNASAATKAPPLLDVSHNLERIGLVLEGVAEGIRKILNRSTDTPISNGEDCLLQVLYERLDDEAATLHELATKGGG